MKSPRPLPLTATMLVLAGVLSGCSSQGGETQPEVSSWSETTYTPVKQEPTGVSFDADPAEDGKQTAHQLLDALQDPDSDPQEVIDRVASFSALIEKLVDTKSSLDTNHPFEDDFIEYAAEFYQTLAADSEIVVDTLTQRKGFWGGLVAEIELTEHQRHQLAQHLGNGLLLASHSEHPDLFEGLDAELFEVVVVAHPEAIGGKALTTHILSNYPAQWDLVEVATRNHTAMAAVFSIDEDTGFDRTGFIKTIFTTDWSDHGKAATTGFTWLTEAINTDTEQDDYEHVTSEGTNPEQNGVKAGSLEQGDSNQDIGQQASDVEQAWVNFLADLTSPEVFPDVIGKVVDSAPNRNLALGTELGQLVLAGTQRYPNTDSEDLVRITGLLSTNPENFQGFIDDLDAHDSQLTQQNPFDKSQIQRIASRAAIADAGQAQARRYELYLDGQDSPHTDWFIIVPQRFALPLGDDGQPQPVESAYVDDVRRSLFLTDVAAHFDVEPETDLSTTGHGIRPSQINSEYGHPLKEQIADVLKQGNQSAVTKQQVDLDEAGTMFRDEYSKQLKTLLFENRENDWIIQGQ